MTALYDLTAHQAHDLLQRGEINSEELTQDCLRRIREEQVVGMPSVHITSLI